MKAVIGFMLLLLGTATTDMAGECDMAAFYTELGCTALAATDPCPEVFTCPDLHPDSSMCYYRGIAYSVGTTIPQAQVKNPCSQACTCQMGPEPNFDCAAVDCVETFDSDMQQCVSTYELNSCCSVGTVCGTDAIAKLITCEVDGKTYKEGEAFEPKNTQKSCICTNQWNGTVDNPEYCRDINCGIEIYYQDEIQKNCAPVFFGEKKGCPITFQCPTNSTQVVRGINVRGINSQCLFGNMTMNVGDEVTVEEDCITCSCQVPPFVTCVRKMACVPNQKV